MKTGYIMNWFLFLISCYFRNKSLTFNSICNVYHETKRKRIVVANKNYINNVQVTLHTAVYTVVLVLIFEYSGIYA